MELRDHPDWHDVVKRNWRKTTGYLLALSQPCIKIQDDELEAIRGNRVLLGLDATALQEWSPQGSWMLAVLLCPGDAVAPIVEWVQGRDPDRIRFYAHPRTDVFAALEPWQNAGLPPPAVDEDIDSWKRFHKRFGRDLSVQILKDGS